MSSQSLPFCSLLFLSFTLSYTPSVSLASFFLLFILLEHTYTHCASLAWSLHPPTCSCCSYCAHTNDHFFIRLVCSLSLPPLLPPLHLHPSSHFILPSLVPLIFSFSLLSLSYLHLLATQRLAQQPHTDTTAGKS